MRLIDADALLHEIGELKKSPWYNENYCGMFSTRKEAVEIIEDMCIKDAPTVDAVRHGIWTITFEGDGEGGELARSYCSECGYKTKAEMFFKYCPNCGARMDGEL